MFEHLPTINDLFNREVIASPDMNGDRIWNLDPWEVERFEDARTEASEILLSLVVSVEPNVVTTWIVFLPLRFKRTLVERELFLGDDDLRKVRIVARVREMEEIDWVPMLIICLVWDGELQLVR